ncbi:DegT/DnrJ/EryC1/StrS family aminotransferase [Aliarcobacter butzleri]|uniref:DegT/DnrJ/EryC1/StrS family aminotransferase n=1 Tax=Aliarcobacter butzleri TaxID=28197 RepID=UPI001EDB8BB5|nr:DegT/DnrJ/EryC1/StrS family aminotransferase [Aliarcobacter butzleri]MCG3710623.1 DegT/DnrJ/EryC1/StrS family aminotransferase [Aliarcobacter butzleri]MCG3714116.1 DegT/DnrJ/EryC1/StrS family aminotransferase [Aliarcobacter butzleri]
MDNKPIYVTQPSLPPLNEYTELLKGVWESGILTHNGPLVQRLEKELCHKLSLENFITVTNGTIALQMAIKALELKGEIITTPFSWIATISAIKSEGCTPIFCDIDIETLNIDPSKIESLISDKTVAIMPVHVFGNPCDVDAIEVIAKKHNLKVIYDAAHAIGSTYKDKSLLSYGDISATSLHGTKLLNTAEGGGCVTNDTELHEKLKRIRFFGHDDSKDIIEDGFNGKMTEVHAALGVANLKYYDEVLQDRKEKYNYYKEKLSSNKNLTFQTIKYGEPNYSYFPIIFQSQSKLLEVEKALNEQKIYPRRYFYPSLNTYNKVLEYVKMPISEDISKRILCLPLYWKLNYADIDVIIKTIKDNI